MNNAETNIPRHDMLEVNNYFMSGLTSSCLDKWFAGPTPHFKRADLGISDYNHDTLKEALDSAFKIAEDPAQMAWQTVRIHLIVALIRLMKCNRLLRGRI